MWWEVGFVGQNVRREEFGDVFSFEVFCGRKQCGVTLELISVSKVTWLICNLGFKVYSRNSK
jgi:hypothetical protein